MTVHARDRIPVRSRRDAVRLLGTGSIGLAAACRTPESTDTPIESPTSVGSTGGRQS